MSLSLANLIDSLLVRFARFVPRTIFWELRAKGIDQAWGNTQDDYPVLERVIRKTGATAILDIGCGTGRLFPIFLRLGIKRIVGQDVSRWALREARRRYPNQAIALIRKPMTSIAPATPFDLTISNRVLSAVRPAEIEKTLRHLASITRFLYLNEFSESDDGRPSTYWFRHEYLGIWKTICPFTLIESGRIGKQTYHVLEFNRPK